MGEADEAPASIVEGRESAGADEKVPPNDAGVGGKEKVEEYKVGRFVQPEEERLERGKPCWGLSSV